MKHFLGTVDADNIWEALGFMALTVSLFLTLFGSWVWAQGNMALLDAKQNENIAVLFSQVSDVRRDVVDIKDKLFAVLMLSIGATLGAVTSAIFSFRAHRRLKNGART